MSTKEVPVVNRPMNAACGRGELTFEQHPRFDTTLTVVDEKGEAVGFVTAEQIRAVMKWAVRFL